MPFRDDLKMMYDVITKECRASGIKLIRGDMADEQQIVLSIWEEIGRATHIIVDLTGFNLNVCLELGIANALGRNTFIIGQQGTERKLFRSIEKRRCHPYPSNPTSEPNFMKALRDFLSV